MPKKKFTDGGANSERNADAFTTEREAPAGDRFVYRVAELAWTKGLAPNSILKAIKQESGGAFNIMQVKLALSKALPARHPYTSRSLGILLSRRTQE